MITNFNGLDEEIKPTPFNCKADALSINIKPSVSKTGVWNLKTRVELPINRR